MGGRTWDIMGVRTGYGSEDWGWYVRTGECYARTGFIM
jgi:hypothetical protein